MVSFEPSGEKEITKAISTAFAKEFQEHIENDVIIVGSGPSGLMASKELAEKRVKVLIIEANNYLGGGFWFGGYLMNKVTVRAPTQELLDELDVPYEDTGENVFVADGPHACSKLIAAACDAGAKVFNMTRFEDVILRENNRLVGVVINWAPIQALPKEVAYINPVGIEAKLIIDATGHDAAVVRKMEEHKLIEVAGQGSMWVEKSEGLIVENTRIVYPGLIVAGMAVSATYGLPRMGPTFGAMLLSGKKAAQVAYEKLQERD